MEGRLYKTRNRICSPFENFFLGIHQEGYHLVHHLYPKLPAWKLSEAHKFLMETNSEYNALHSILTPGWIPIIKLVMILLRHDRHLKMEIVKGLGAKKGI